MNPIKQLWHLICDSNETPAVAKSREIEAESYVRQAETKRIIDFKNGDPVGPLLRYIRGVGKPND